MGKKISTVLILIALSFLLCSPAPLAQDNENSFYLIPIQEVITSGSASFIERNLQLAEAEEVQATIILLDTPGGLVDATLKINRLFRTHPRPIIVLVAPTGAMAASAGSFLVLGADIAVMAPGTTIGAAQPITMTPAGTEPADDKTVQFMASHLRSLARENNRPADIAERFVTENLTLDAWEALEKEVIDLMASNTEEMLGLLDGYTLEKGGQIFTLSTQNPVIIESEMNLREQVQNFVSNPQIAFLLLMLGGLGVYLGLSAPGTFVPEILGSLALVLAIYGLGLFSTNVTGIILLVIGIGLMIAEAFTAGFGILGISGAVSLVFGAILLPHEPLMDPEWYQAFRTTVLGVGIAVSILLLIVIQRVISSRLRRKQRGPFMTPKTGRVTRALNPRGTVKAQGELWNAREVNGNTVQEGEQVKVIGQEGLELLVKKENQS